MGLGIVCAALCYSPVVTMPATLVLHKSSLVTKSDFSSAILNHMQLDHMQLDHIQAIMIVMIVCLNAL